ncbi:MAG: hypothetical protein IJ043_01465 [Clostridia bacterium]|nr:hypothetical protein [Clostridia bacterium]
MENLYILRRRVSMGARRKAVSFACRLGMVAGFIAFIAIWAGMEFGPLLLGWRLLWTAADAVFVAAAAIGWMRSEGQGNE